MQPLILRIQNYVNSLSKAKIEAILSQITETRIEIQSKELESNLRKSLTEYLAKGYLEYISKLNMTAFATARQLDKEPELVPDSFNDRSEQAAVYMAYQIYRNFKFHRSSDVIDFFNTRGIRNTYLTHFIDINQLENLMMSLIEDGVFINTALTLIIVDITYDLRIANELNTHFVSHKIISSYDGRKNVNEAEIAFLNTLRRRKYHARLPLESSDFNLFDKMLDEIEEMDTTKDKLIVRTVKDGLLSVMRENKNSPKLLLQFYFGPFVKKWGVSKVKRKFKPLFYILFENSQAGLLTEDEFEKYFGNSAKYDGRYSKYYNTRLDSLVGFKQLK